MRVAWTEWQSDCGRGCPATRPVDSVVMPVAWTVSWWNGGRGLFCDQSGGLDRHACGLDSVAELRKGLSCDSSCGLRRHACGLDSVLKKLRNSGTELSCDQSGGLGRLACGLDSVPVELRKGVVLQPVR